MVDKQRWNNARAWTYTISSPCESDVSGELIDKRFKIYQPCVLCSMTSLATERLNFDFCSSSIIYLAIAVYSGEHCGP